MASVKQELSDHNSLLSNEIAQHTFSTQPVPINNMQQDQQQLLTIQPPSNPIIIGSSGLPLVSNLQSPVKVTANAAMTFSLNAQPAGTTQLNLSQVPVNMAHGQNLVQVPRSQTVTLLSNTSHSTVNQVAVNPSNVSQLTVNPTNVGHSNVNQLTMNSSKISQSNVSQPNINISNVSQPGTNQLNINQLSQRLIRISVSQGGSSPQTFIINNSGQIVSQLQSIGQTATQTTGAVSTGNTVATQPSSHAVVGNVASQVQPAQPSATTSVPGQSLPVMQQQLVQKSQPVSTSLVVAGQSVIPVQGKAVLMNSLPTNLAVKQPILPKGASPEKQILGQASTRSVFVPITMASVGSTQASGIQIRSIAPRLALATGATQIRPQLAPKAIAPQPTQLIIPAAAGGTTAPGTFLISRQGAPAQIQNITSNVVKIQGPGGQLMQAVYVPQAIRTASGVPQAAVIVGPAINDPNKEEQPVNGDPSDSKPVKKPCNCTKSQCLKLYCDCFANGEFCSNCNCNNCSNNIEHEAERSKAIKACLDRNPHAFHPKIGKGKGEAERRHTKGCHCKRSGCLKNYCECYEAKILCSTRCKCTGCKNFEESPERKTLMHLADAAEVRVLQQNAARSKLESQLEAATSRSWTTAPGAERLPAMFITNDVAKATCDCLMAQAEEAEVKRMSSARAERLILEEFSRCLLHIIHSAERSGGHNT